MFFSIFLREINVVHLGLDSSKPETAGWSCQKKKINRIVFLGTLTWGIQKHAQSSGE